MTNTTPIRIAMIAACAFCLLSEAGIAQVADRTIRQTENVGVDEKLGTELPLHLKFLNENGNAIRLDSLFKAGRPVILSMNYSKCPQLCDLQLGGLIRSFEQGELNVGKDFALVSVSFDPKETPHQAKEVLQRYQQTFGQPTGNDGMNFLVGNRDGIRSLASALGIRYEFVPMRQEYAHPAVFVVCSPDGIISRYVYGVDFPPADLKIWLNEARQGNVAEPTENSLSKIVWNCFYYDETAGVYTKTAWYVVRISGLLFMASVFGLLYWCHRLVQSKQKQLSSETTGQSATRSMDSHLGYTQ